MPVTTIFGGQFGSEGKGLVASWVVKMLQGEIALATTDAGPNAGHTAYWNGKPVVTFHLPMTGVLSPSAIIWLNGGSVIDPNRLLDEVEKFDRDGFNVSPRLLISPSAAIITHEDLVAEGDPHGTMNMIASTKKGVGHAAARKMMRMAKLAEDEPLLTKWVMEDNNVHVDPRKHTVVEVAQGFSLGIDQGFYPYTTFRHCTPQQGLMNAKIPPNTKTEVIAVIRVNPIRVGNVPGGFSGDCYPDQEETTWDTLGQPPQYTTVTNRIRRVFTYSQMQVNDMIDVCKPTVILVNFAQTAEAHQLHKIVNGIKERYMINDWDMPTIYTGWGPAPEEIKVWAV